MRHVIDYQMSDKLLNSLLILIRRQGCKLRDILSINNFHFQLKSEEHTRRRLSTVAARAKQTAARRSSSNQYNSHLSTPAIFLADSPYIHSCFNLFTTATSLQWPRLYNGHFLGADSPYIDSCFNLSTTATFFCPQGGRCGEVRLYFVMQNLEFHLSYLVFGLSFVSGKRRMSFHSVHSKMVHAMFP